MLVSSPVGIGRSVCGHRVRMAVIAAASYGTVQMVFLGRCAKHWRTRRRDIVVPGRSLAGQICINLTRSSQFVSCDLLDKLDSPQPWRLYPHERLSEREPVGRGEEVRHMSRRRCLSVRRPVEEERYRDLQDMRDVLQAARADAVPSLLVFLHLLEREPEPLGEFLLAHTEH